ncbi:hypothetical protein BRC60_04355 [Halobacteriales archaeon QH_1_68_42]|nr:MAG: hypothetical protein BRC60_04355 [Halobacteriales archaeon QH_1_68_42]
MPWVRSEYAGELAVLSVWLTALLPWSVSYFNETIAGRDVTVINIRFLFFQFHYLSGISFGEQSIDDLVQLIHEIPAFVPDNQQLEAEIWVAGAVLFALLLALSFLYYVREEDLTERVPVDLVRLFGGAFALLALVFTAVVVLFNPHQLTVPVGTLFMWVFAIVLLRIERT